MEKIVVGVDGSEESKNALRWAVAEARVHGASVTAVHAWQPPPPVPEIAPVPTFDVSIVPALQEAAEQLVRRVVEEVVARDSDVAVEPTAVEGPAASVLSDAADGADLLVVGSRGHGGFTGLLLGSVSQQVANHAPCPVVIHRRRQ